MGVLVFAQSRVVSGKVTDEQNNPVPFATVTEEGTKNGVTADENGNFSIKMAGQHLTVTSTGHKTQTITVTGDVASIKLARTEGQLQEVVVVALGQTRSRGKVGYATTTFNSDQINRGAPANVLDGLSGKIPGANISKTGGPGSSTKVILRGYGVIGGGNNQPLYVVDGIPLSDARFAADDNNLDYGNGLNDINPNDIENISILRGTAGASLYGSAAKNGAIMITTKRGKSGKIKIDYAGSVNYSLVGKLPDFQKTFGQGWQGLFIPSENGSWGPRLDGKTRLWGAIVDNSQLLKPFSFQEDNMRDFYDVGREYNNTIAFSGGNEGTQFYFSYGNVYSDGIIPTKTDYYQRNTVSLRTNSKFKNLAVNTSFNYSKKNQNVPFTGQAETDGGSAFEDILQIPVDINISQFQDYKNKFFNVDNYFTPFAENPYYELYENRNKQNSDRFFGDVDLNYKFTPDFSAQLRIGGDFANARTFRYKAVNAPSPGSYNAGGNVEGASRTADVGSVSEAAGYLGTINSDLILKYNKNLSSNFNLEALGGLNYYQEEQHGSTGRITNLLIPGFYNLSNSTIKPVTTDFTQNHKRIGTYAQATLTFANQLSLTLNARNDWSSTLPIGKNSFFYPGANLSWIASQTFDLGSVFSYLKFRASYGKTGADAQPYLTKTTLVLGSASLPFGTLDLPFNGVGGYGISNTIGNPILEPIITSEAAVGSEMRFLKNRLSLDVELYDKRTKGQILPVPISPSTGYRFLVSNLGEISNKGVEIAFDVKPIVSKDVNWSVTYTFAKNWNKVISLTAGLDKVILNTAYDAELDAYPGKSVTGLYAPVPRFSPDGKIIVNAATGMPLEDTAKAFYGNAEYDYMMGMLNTFTYKDFTLAFSFDYRKGGVMYSGTADLTNFTGNAYVTTYNDRRPFIVPNSVIEVPDPSVPGKINYEENQTVIDETNYTDYWYPTQNKAGSYYQRIISRSFLKLRDVSLAYSLPKMWASKIKASNLAVSIYGRNFLIWTPKSNVYLDPEATNQGNDLGSELGEFRTAPTSCQFGVSLKASF